MAAEYLRVRAAQAGLSHVVVESAGTLGIVGAPAASEAVAVCKEAGVDLSAHRSRALSRHDVRSSDLVLAMAREHLEYCREIGGRLAPGGFLLRAFENSPHPSPDPRDLDDPVGLPLAAFRESLQVIRVCIDHLIIRLRHTT